MVDVDHDRLVEVATRTARSQGAHGEISVTLVGEDKMSELHLEYMKEAGPTDVLSFPVDGLQSEQLTSPGIPSAGLTPEPPVLIGEVVICPEFAARAGTDLRSELDLLTAHGVLHLLGHDHHDEQGARKMRAAEKSVLGRSGATAK